MQDFQLDDAMYLPTDHAPRSDYPSNGSFPEGDWHILAGFWHPVAFASEIGDKPVKSRLLDVDLVIYRTVDGLTVAKDVCIHRGTALSLGWLDERRENIVCPMHGLHYDKDGRCTRIPSRTGHSTPIPRKLCLTTFQAIERYGIVWTCLKPKAIHPLPDWPLLENAGAEWQTYQVPRGRWKASASRHCENFNDVAHLSWVHMKTFGNRNRPEIADHKPERTDYGLRMSLPYIEIERGFNDQLGERERDTVYTYELTYPFASTLRIDYAMEGGATMTTYIYDVACPVSARDTAVYQLNQTNIPGMTRERHVEYQMITNEEDVALVESQRPEEVPLNLAEEGHIPADRFSAQYRRDLVSRFGLGSPTLVS